MTTTQKYTSNAKARREELKAISLPLKELVKSGEYDTLNAALIDKVYKRDGNNIFKTFEQWKAEGYSIAKGSQAFVVWGSPREIQKEEGKEDEEKKEFYPICYLFSNRQVYKRNSANAEEPQEKYHAFKEIQVQYKSCPTKLTSPIIRTSRDAYDAIRPVYEEMIEYREMFTVLLLNKANKLLGYSIIGVGGMASTTADPKLIFQSALLAHASGIILCHNHPSGNLNPSPADMDLTKKIKSAAEFLDIQVLDHLIIAFDGYGSFSDEGWL